MRRQRKYNPIATVLRRDGAFKPRIVRSKKTYTRKQKHRASISRVSIAGTFSVLPTYHTHSYRNDSRNEGIFSLVLC